MTTFQIANKQVYKKFSNDLEELYLNTFTTGISAQQISREKAENYLETMFEVGYGIFGLQDNKLVAALVATPPSLDIQRPEHIQNSYPDGSSIYIAEVLVDESVRGQGLGQQLVQSFENHLSTQIKHVLLRVWQKNKPAVMLYYKMGFKICGEITQEKIRPDSKEKFTMHKNYMVKSY